MSGLIVLFALIALALYGLQEFYQIRLGIRPSPAPRAVIDELAHLLENNAPSGTFAELGSGYGGLIFNLAKRLPAWQFIGFEKSPTPWIIAQLRSVANNFGNYRFYIDDARDIQLRNYDVIFVDQNAAILKQWENGLARRLQPGTLLITLNAPLPRIKASSKTSVDGTHTLYFYRKAASRPAEMASTSIDELMPEPTTETVSPEDAI